MLDSRSNEIYNNSLASNYEDSAGGHVGLKFLAELTVVSLLTDSNYHSKNNIIKNNFIYAEDSILAVGIDNESITVGGNVFFHNLYWNKDNNDVWQWGDITGNDDSTWNYIASASDFIEDPNWTVPDPEQAEDFKLSDYSVLFQRGVNVGLSRDYEGNPVLNPPSIGAYEYESNGVEVHDRDALPKRYNLYQNYPNPFTSLTNIKYSIRKPGSVELNVYNIVGQLVKTLVNESQKAGNYSVTWNSRDDKSRVLSSGIYFVKLKVEDEFLQTKKILFLR